GFVSLQDAEGRYRCEPVEVETPEALFERSWALDLLRAALAALRAEYASRGQAERFDALKCYLPATGSDVSYAEKAAELDMKENALRKAVFDLRDRYRERLRWEIKQTLNAPTQEDIDEEAVALLAALHPARRAPAAR